MSDIGILEELLTRVSRLERAAQTERKNRNQKEAAEYLNMSVFKLRQLHREGRGPKHIIIGRTYNYRQDDLDEFLATEE
jgi:excisionase family DNA binding protein